MRQVFLTSLLLFAYSSYASNPVSGQPLPRLEDMLAPSHGGIFQDPGSVIEDIGSEAERAIQDIPNVPGNILREGGAALERVDEIRRELETHATAPLLAAWIRESRNTARPSAMPVPDYIRNTLGNFFDQDIYNRTRYKIGDEGFANLGGLAIRVGDQDAVVLDDTIIFVSQDAASDPVLWAHELHHVEQYRDWGVDEFAIHYIRSYNSVENAANGREAQFEQIYQGGG